LADAARDQGLEAEVARGVDDALDRALRGPGAPPHVIICGSLHFIGDVLALSPDTWPT
jgi:dihydrofolate synthase/folylpolyglutamate synthase